MKQLDLSIGALRKAYLTGDLTLQALLDYVKTKIEAAADNPIWISLLSDEQLQTYVERLADTSPTDKPLYGIPFAIKDNIDLAGVATTAACKEYAYTPETSAFVVQRLIDAGAIPIGKTNLDQFATGLVGTRSPYGAVRNAFNDDYIAGGSSSGSAVAVALGLVSFALGTDTAGSGRVPAGFNNLFGLKPTRGRLSTAGVIPACRSLDCVNLFALNPDDMRELFTLVDCYDQADAYARDMRTSNCVFHAPLRIGVPQPAQLAFFGNADYQQCFESFTESLQAQGHKITLIDFEPFKQAAAMLYQGPWVAERYAAIQSFIQEHADAMHPVTRQIIEPATDQDAIGCFRAQYAMQDLKREADSVLAGVDLICIPTAGTHYTLAEIEQEPVTYNSNLGYYTNFMNLLDYAALSIPAGFTETGMPFGITLFSQANTDRQLLDVATSIHSDGLALAGATVYGWQPDEKTAVDKSTDFIDVAVCGAHLSNMPLNHQLTERQAVLLKQTYTAACYRLYALAGGPPYRPGLVRDDASGAAIEVEVWRMPLPWFGEFMLGIPQPLGIGKVALEDDSVVNGFICEGYALQEAEDITSYGGWRGYMAARHGG